MEGTEALMGRLVDLRGRFIKTVPGRVDAIAATLARCEADFAAIHQLERQFHTLAGTAGTYGLDSVAITASEAEAVCAEFLETHVNNETFHYLKDLIDQLRAASETVVVANQTGVRAA